MRVKKIAVKILCAALIAAAVCACLCGCGKTNLEKYSSSISELRENLYAAENAEYKVTAISGMREDPYELDGASKGKREFTVITITPANFDAGANYRYRVVVGDETYEGDFLPHPFAQSLSADIPKTVTSEFTVAVICGGEQTFEMENAVTGELISAEKALTIALDKLKNEIKRFRSKGKLNAEIYVRLIENPIDGNGGYFWYVAFVGAEKDTVAVLLTGDTGAVSALRV